MSTGGHILAQAQQVYGRIMAQPWSRHGKGVSELFVSGPSPLRPDDFAALRQWKLDPKCAQNLTRLKPRRHLHGVTDYRGGHRRSLRPGRRLRVYLVLQGLCMFPQPSWLLGARSYSVEWCGARHVRGLHSREKGCAHGSPSRLVQFRYVSLC